MPFQHSLDLDSIYARELPEATGEFWIVSEKAVVPTRPLSRIISSEYLAWMTTLLNTVFASMAEVRAELKYKIQPTLDLKSKQVDYDYHMCYPSYSSLQAKLVDWPDAY